MSTLELPPTVPSPREDVKLLRKAFKGLGCDCSTVIRILAHRDSEQLDMIVQEYENKYSDDLKKKIHSHLHGNFKKVVLLWIQNPVARDAIILRQALKGTVSTDHRATTDIICSRTPSQIRQLKTAFSDLYHVTLESEIEHEAHGDHKKLLIAYINTSRYEGPEADMTMLDNDLKALKTGEAKAYIQIFTDRSRAHLAALIPEYLTRYEDTLEKSIRKKTSGSFEHALLTILRFAENPAMFFAKVLRKAMKGLGTRDMILMWVVCTRAETDLAHIKSEYKKKYGKTLNDAVYSDTSGNYRTFLINLLGPNC